MKLIDMIKLLSGKTKINVVVQHKEPEMEIIHCSPKYVLEECPHWLNRKIIFFSTSADEIGFLGRIGSSINFTVSQNDSEDEDLEHVSLFDVAMVAQPQNMIGMYENEGNNFFGATTAKDILMRFENKAKKYYISKMYVNKHGRLETHIKYE